MQTTVLIFVAVLILTNLALPIQSIGQKQRQAPNETQEESDLTRIKVLQNQFGAGRMTLKDRSIYKKIKIHQINDLWIVYIKNGSTHDMTKDRIDRIEFGREKQATLRFDENGKIKIYIKR